MSKYSQLPDMKDHSEIQEENLLVLLENKLPPGNNSEISLFLLVSLLLGKY